MSVENEKWETVSRWGPEQPGDPTIFVDRIRVDCGWRVRTEMQIRQPDGSVAPTMTPESFKADANHTWRPMTVSFREDSALPDPNRHSGREAA